MKKLALLLLILPFLFSCSDDKEEVLDYTSFVVVNNTEIDMPNSIAGYKVGDSWVKIADLGDLIKGSKSDEIKLTTFIEEDIYVFTDYISPRRLEVPFNLKENQRNTFKFPSDFRGKEVSDKKDVTQYPQ